MLTITTDCDMVKQVEASFGSCSVDTGGMCALDCLIMTSCVLARLVEVKIEFALWALHGRIAATSFGRV